MPDDITLGGVTLPGDLRWIDEFAWSPVARSQEYSLTGALIVQEAAKQTGRPITLEAKNESAGYICLARSQVAALYALVSTPGWAGTLTLMDGRSFAVAFRDEGLRADPVRHIAPHEDADAYTLTLQLQTI
ncbi:MAG TPA: hypothetical protein P5330_12495 [Candidatus Competibacteraceae bacterium]|nr:hypothetical protein [Candidatus Competibacteraceae bacterium]